MSGTARRRSDQQSVAGKSLDKAASDGDVQVNGIGIRSLMTHLVETYVLGLALRRAYADLYCGQRLDRVAACRVKIKSSSMAGMISRKSPDGRY